jgi:hypothetical protein
MRTSLAELLIASLSLVSAGSLAACGGGGGDDDGVVFIDAMPDDPTPPDAAPDQPAVCTVSTDDFGDKGALTGAAIIDVGQSPNDATDDVLEFDALLEAGEPSDAIAILLYAGYGAFAAGPIVPGTYQITGDELDFATCGVCVLLATNATSTGYDDDYMAISGTVTITEAATAVGQNFTGSITNVAFHHVDIDPSSGATTQSADTCETAMSNATFTGATAAPQ